MRVRHNFRLKNGGRINRSRPVSFHFDGTLYQGYEGDTLASALMANGVRIVGRSFKYHRPRGIFSAGVEEPNAIMQIGAPPYEEPNVPATMVEISDGLTARSVNGWPGASRDLLAVFGLFKPFLVAGFYYKTFKYPGWKFWSPWVRRMAGLGTLPELVDPDHYDHCHAHTDMLVIGSGPAGLAAALAQGRAGRRVMLVEQDREFGGSLLFEQNGLADWRTETIRRLRDMANVTLVIRATACGYYDDNLVTLSERPGGGHGPRERFWHVRAGRVIIATGAIERPLVFPDNDRPGVMLASAVRHYITRYGVAPGKTILVVTNNDDAYQTALDARAAGIKVAAIVDVRATPDGALVRAARDAGITIYHGHMVTGCRGRRGVRAAMITAVGQDVMAGKQVIACDVIATSGGWSPVVHLHSQSGGKLRFDDGIQAFVPDRYVQNNICIGAANGTFDLAACLKEGAGEYDIDLPEVETVKSGPVAALRDMHADLTKTRRAKCWVDLLHDVTASDIALAARENYVSVEHMKRYTTTGMAIDQGKTGNVIALAILAQATGRTIPEVGTTKFRPPYRPVTMGAMAARSTGRLFRPLRHLPGHQWHESHGAVMEDYGGWLRPVCYVQAGESEQEAVTREVFAVRRAAGILDYSPLGKIDIRGRDAAVFLNHFYVNNVKSLKTGRARYGLMLNEHGTIIDDGVFARIADNHFQVTTTSGGAAARAAWFDEWRQCEWPDMDVVITPFTTGWATISLQGPCARDILSAIDTDIDLDKASFPHMALRTGMINGTPARILRTSFTGELGFEISFSRSAMLGLWRCLVTAGAVPFGLEALMILRSEKGFIHVGADTDSSTIPDDVGFGPVARRKTDDFIGKRSLSRPDALRGEREGLVGLKAVGDRPLRVGSIILPPGHDTAPAPMAGRVTSSCFSPTLGRPIALGLIRGGSKRLGERVRLYDAGGPREAEVVAPCFYDPDGERLHV